MGAVVLRSDVLRKVLLHRELEERLPTDAYTEAVTRAVYRALGVRAADVLANRGAVIADATFLTTGRTARHRRRGGAGRRALHRRVAGGARRPMAERLRARVGDASDATVDVLEAQRAGDAGPITWLSSRTAAEDPGTLAAMVMAAQTHAQVPDHA